MNRVDQITRKLEEGKLCLGTHISTTDADFYEMCGRMGYDYIWIDNEHAGMTQPMIKNAIIAANAGGCAAFVRVPDHEMAHCKPVLECGPDGVIFPMVNTAEQAEKCVGHCLYPPYGTRGFGPLRAVDYGMMDFDTYVARSRKMTLRLLQCESRQAVENLDEILEVPGVDAIICGPMDLSASVHKIGRFDDPEVMALMNTIIRKCKAKKKPFGLSIGPTCELPKYWLAQGAAFVSLGTPQDYFRDMGLATVREMRALEEKRVSTSQKG